MASNAAEFPVHITRVVTGHASGKSVVAEVGVPPRTDVYQHIPGMVARLIWSTENNTSQKSGFFDPTPNVTSVVPPPGSTRFLIVTFPPDSVFASPDFDGNAAHMENLRISPGLAERFEPNGMHKTPTIDYGILLSGELHLELDDGQEQKLKPFDVVVQNGTRHAWRNKSQHGATMAFVLVGSSDI